jgi:2-polyprenyl-3-methyl-5-hydroxy-6-metoxy-1,4-benzoquinol methylase
MNNIQDMNIPILMDNKDLRKLNPAIEMHFNAAEKEFLDFTTEKNLVRNPNCIDFINCPVCKSKDTSQLLVKWGGRYDECKVCSHIFLKNPLKHEILTALYKSSIADQLNREVQKHSFNERYWFAVYKKYMDLISEQFINHRKLIDVGCGTGRFLRFCKENYDFELSALDVFNELVESVGSAVSKDNIFLVDSFERTDIKRKFNVITLWGVLEHCRSPHDVLTKCHDYLEESGLLLILIPNIHSRARKLLGVYTPTLSPREHINFFTPQSMEEVALKNGFNIEYFYQELPVIDLMWQFIDEESAVIDEIIENNECYYHVYILKKQ